MAEMRHADVDAPADAAQPAPAIRVVASPLLTVAVVLVPLAVTAVLIAFHFFEGDPMLGSGLAAVVVGFVVFLVFASPSRRSSGPSS
jgi:membrane protein YdbS with pleckstrin-like domain